MWDNRTENRLNVVPMLEVIEKLDFEIYTTVLKT